MQLRWLVALAVLSAPLGPSVGQRRVSAVDDRVVPAPRQAPVDAAVERSARRAAAANHVERSARRAAAANHVERSARRAAAANHDERERAACADRRRTLGAEPELPGAPGLEAGRAEIVARAKNEPVLFLTTPEPRALTPRAAVLRKLLFETEPAWTALEHVYGTLRRSPEELRQVLLTDGYLYAEQANLAALLASSVTLTSLFQERRIAVARGDRLLHAERKGGEYVWTDGPEAGKPARLWLFDRAALDDEALLPLRHVGLGDLERRLGASAIEIERLSAGGALGRLRYPGLDVPAVFRFEQGRLELDCELVGPELAERLDAARVEIARRARVLAALERAIKEQIDEELPFDEPKTEDGQQDGKLRFEWQRAYLDGRTRYRFNDDDYHVFDRAGRPRIPQVCVDFIVDTWERMSGTWWQARDEGRARRVGRIDFRDLGIENRRSVEQMLEFARARQDWFELLEVPHAERVAFRDRARFFERLYAERERYRPGDVVAILGPRDDDLLHYHSFFIVAADPLTGMPTRLAANAGRPRVRSWEDEMRNAPRRAIVARVRPALAWLEALLPPGQGAEARLAASGARTE